MPEAVADMGEIHWYALAVRSRCEKGVAQELKRQGVENYLPIQREKRIWRDRIKSVECALFPGYVFVRSALVGRERFRILDLADVICVVSRRGDKKFEAIPDSEIESVMLLAEQAEAVETCDLVRGTHVVVGLGPLKGVSGVVEENASGKHIVCSISLLGRAVRTKIDPDHLIRQ